MNNEVIVDSIKALCKNKNLSASQLEKEIGLSQGLISKWTKTMPSLDKIIDIADYFHVSLDKVVGYKLNTSDNFISILINRTLDKTIIWHSPENDIAVKLYTNNDLINNVYINNDELVELTYYTEYKNGYISVYGLSNHFNAANPIELILYIQPSQKSDIVIQNYSMEELKLLWLEILSSLGNEAPDEIKAEIFKNEFIKSSEELEGSNKLKRQNTLLAQKLQETDAEYLNNMISLDDIALLTNEAEYKELLNSKIRNNFDDAN